MYYCKTCHIGHMIKPYDEARCAYCNSETIIKLSKKTNIIIEHIDLTSTYDSIINEFYTINNFPSRSTNYHRNRTSLFKININDHIIKRPYGFIYDNLSDFTKLSKQDLDQIWIKLFGKSNIKYYAYDLVKIKCSLYDHFILIPMSLTTIIDWFNNNENTYHITYNNSRWCLEQLSDDNIITPLIERIIRNGKEQDNNVTSGFYNSHHLLLS